MGAAYLFQNRIDLGEASYKHAYQLRDRLTEKCRLDAEINYYSYTVGDSEKVYSSALRFLEIFPRDVPAHANFRMALLFLGQPDRAADEAAEIARLQPGAYRFGSATQSIRFASRFSEAKSWLAKSDPLRFDNLLIRRERLIVAFATGDRDSVERILKEEEPGRNREDFLFEHSLIEIQRGRFRSAERLRLQPLRRTSKDSNEWVVLSALENAEVGILAYIRGLAYLSLGDGQSAAAQFQKLIDNPYSFNYVLGKRQVMLGSAAEQQPFLSLQSISVSALSLRHSSKSD